MLFTEQNAPQHLNPCFIYCTLGIPALCIALQFWQQSKY